MTTCFKKALFCALLLVFCITFISCSYKSVNTENRTPETEDIVETNASENLEEAGTVRLTTAQYSNMFEEYYYSSLNEFMFDLKSMETSEKEYIRRIENANMLDTAETCYITDEEKELGIFDVFYDNIVSRNTVYFPHINGKPISLSGEYSYCIKFSFADAFRRPQITYYTDDGYSVSLTYYDKALRNEATVKGASWLMRTLDSSAIGVDNFKDIKKEIEEGGDTSLANLDVYEKTYSLADRTVKALVLDHSADEIPCICLYIVYDDIIACVYGDYETVEGILPELTFEEVQILQSDLTLVK